MREKSPNNIKEHQEAISMQKSSHSIKFKTASENQINIAITN
jgi:hypothetical protein